MKRPFFSHHRLGYRRNPFGALTADEWPQVAFLPTAVAQTLADGYAGHLQLLGPMGSGKSSALRKLAADWVGQTAVYEYIPEGQNRFFTALDAAVDLFVLDEAQRLSRWQRRRWLSWLTRDARRRCFWGSHQDLTAVFARYKLPLRTIHIDQHISPAHYGRWLQQRLAFFALPDRPRVTFDETAVAFLHEQFGADMREAEYFLYELFQAITSVQVLTAEALRPYFHRYQSAAS